MSDYLPDGDLVSLSVPADVAYVATLRLTAAALAARCDLTIDDIEDLRLAVDEACTLVLPHTEARTLDATFVLHAQQLNVTITATGPATSVDRTGFAWTVLGALATDLDVTTAQDSLAVRFSKRRTAGVA